jgi:TolA-binding protein
MNSAKNALLVLLLLGSIGFMGCGEAQVSSRTAAHIRQLEGRNTKLEEDYRATVAECVQLRKKLAETSSRCVLLQKQRTKDLEQVSQQRDELQQRVNTVTGEREALQGQLVGISRDLQALIGRVEQATTNRGAAAVGSTVSMKKEG